MIEQNKNIKYLLLAPCITWFLIFAIYPLFYSLKLSLFRKTLSGQVFAGLTNFYRAFNDYRFWNDLRVTFVFIALSVILEFFLGFGLALLLNQKIKGKKFFRIIFTIPLFVCPVAISYMGLILLNEENGIINFVINNTLGFSKIAWLSDPSMALISCILLDVWQWTSFTFLVLTAGLQSFPTETYEAAKVDGASNWQAFRYITLPLLSPIILTTILFKLIYSLKVFDIPLNLTSGGPGISSEAYSIFIYRTGLKYLDVGYAAALSYIFLIAVLLFSMGLISRMRKIYIVEGE